MELIKLNNSSIVFEERKYLYLLKFFAILSVVSAHSSRLPESFSYINKISSLILLSIGSMGVPVFLIISGYLFNKNQKTFVEFFRIKIKTIFIPWMVCETIVWLYVTLRKGGVSFLSLFSFLFGLNHSTYYLTVLSLLFIIYFYFKNYNSFLVITIVTSILSIIATSMGVNKINDIITTPYLNPLNWMIYFSVGILINRYFQIEKIAVLTKKLLYFSIPALAIILFFHLRNGLSLSYWSDFIFLNMLFSILVIFGLSSYLLNWSSTFFVMIGNYSFSIYLLHELVVGVVVYLSSKIDLWYITLIRPIITILIVMVGIISYKKLVSILNCNNALMFIGYREPKEERMSA